MLIVRHGQGGRSRASYSQTTLVGGATTSTKKNLTPRCVSPVASIPALLQVQAPDLRDRLSHLPFLVLFQSH